MTAVCDDCETSLHRSQDLSAHDSIYSNVQNTVAPFLINIQPQLWNSRDMNPSSLSNNDFNPKSLVHTVAVMFVGVWETDNCRINDHESWLVTLMAVYTSWIFLFITWVFILNQTERWRQGDSFMQYCLSSLYEDDAYNIAWCVFLQWALRSNCRERWDVVLSEFLCTSVHYNKKCFYHQFSTFQKKFCTVANGFSAAFIIGTIAFNVAIIYGIFGCQKK